MGDVATIRRFRVPLDQIAYVRMILEGYDGLAVMTSDPGDTIVTWAIAPGREDEADRLAAALAAETGLQPLPAIVERSPP